MELTTKLYNNGTASDILDEWVQMLENQASDSMDASTIDQEAAKIAEYFEAE